MVLHKVRENTGLARSPENKAILNVDHASLLKYKTERQKIVQEKALAEDVMDLKTEVEGIKSMLETILREIKKK